MNGIDLSDLEKKYRNLLFTENEILSQLKMLKDGMKEFPDVKKELNSLLEIYKKKVSDDFQEWLKKTSDLNDKIVEEMKFWHVNERLKSLERKMKKIEQVKT